MNLYDIKFISQLAGEVEAVTAENIARAESNEDPEAEGVTIVGELTPALRALCYLRLSARVEHRRAAADAELALVSERETNEGKVSFLERRSKTIEHLFWVCLYAEYPELLGKTKIGYYRGWKVGFEEGGGEGSSLADLLGFGRR